MRVIRCNCQLLSFGFNIQRIGFSSVSSQIRKNTKLISANTLPVPPVGSAAIGLGRSARARRPATTRER
jgi:hypothetical protein